MQLSTDVASLSILSLGSTLSNYAAKTESSSASLLAKRAADCVSPSGHGVGRTTVCRRKSQRLCTCLISDGKHADLTRQTQAPYRVCYHIILRLLLRFYLFLIFWLRGDVI